jgi:hypothetical protein
MPLYHVTWEIDLNAKTPKAAACKALEIQRDPQSTATVFSVSNQKGAIHTIDLDTIEPI